MASKQDLRQRLVKAGYNPNDVAVMSDAQLEIFAQKVLPELYGQAGNPKFKTVESLGGGVGGRAGKVVGTNPDGSISVKSSGVVTITKISFDTYMSLASTIGHELNHMIDYVTGCYQNWANKYGMQGAKTLSEISAYSWELSVNSSYYNSQIHNDFINQATQNGWRH